jgi:hypothetical protein
MKSRDLLQQSSFILLGLAVLALVVRFSLHAYSAPIQPGFTLQSFLGSLSAILVIVLLVERATEVGVAIWRAEAVAILRVESRLLAKDPNRNDDLAAKNSQLAAYQAATRRRTLLVGFVIGIVVCCAGVGLLQSVVVVGAGNGPFLRGVDIVLTAALIAGGSDGFHQFTSTLESFLAETKNSIQGKS